MLNSLADFRREFPNASDDFIIANGFLLSARGPVKEAAPKPPSYRKLTLLGEKPLSLNKYWAGMHYRARSAEKNRVKALVQSHLDKSIPMFDRPVKMRFTVYFDGRRYDASNLVPKPYEDALADFWFPNDSAKYVVSWELVPKIDKKCPRVEIEAWAIVE